MVLCAGAFGCYAAQGSLPGAQGQGYDLNLSYSRTTLKAVADAITQQVGIAFSYETALAGYPMENLEVSEKGATIEAILAAVFTPRGIDYRVVDKVVVLTRSTRPVPAASAAAKSEVKGVVRDAAGNPMIGVTVTIKGTLVGVSTGVDGGYAIPADGNATLLFSYIGYRPHEEVVGRRTQIDVTMQEDELVMDEVVVVGYGTLKKRNIVGAVENLSGDAVENRPNANITRSLQGQIPGLNIVQVDGKADHAGEVTIRGVNNTFKARVSGGEKTNKLGQGGGALVLIDGAEGDMGSVNPDDIASISVLKDASSAAVYGARGAFGVILITTKNPEKGKVRVSYNGSVSLHRRTVIWEDNVVTDPVQWVDAFRESYLNSSPTATVPSLFNNYMPYSNAWFEELKRRRADPTMDNYDIDANGNYNYYGETNWLKEIYKSVNYSTTHAVSIQGGREGVSYYISGRYYNQDGIYKVGEETYKKYNLRAKGSIRIRPWLTLDNNTSLMSSKYHQPMVHYGQQVISRQIDMFAFPFALLKNPDGTWTQTAAKTGYAAFAEGTSWQENNKLEVANTTTFNFEFVPDVFKVSADVTYKGSRWSRDRMENLYTYYTGVNVSGQDNSFSSLENWTYRSDYISTNIVGTVTPKLGADHDLNVVAGWNLEDYDYRTQKTYRQGNLYPSKPSFTLMDGEYYSTTSGGYTWGLVGFFGRVNYAYAGRYLAEVSARYDGSSKFPSSSQWGFFPSASVGWRLSEEPWLKPHVEGWLDNFKVRASIGSLGNANIDPYQYLETMTASGSASIAKSSVIINGQNVPYTSVPSLIPDDITWEKVTTYNIGLDLDLFHNRLSFTGDYYRRNTTDLYTVGPNLPQVLGSAAPYGNYASLKTKGWELSLSWRDSFNLGGKPFSYSIKGMLWDSRSWITDYYNETGDLTTYYKGMEIGEIWGFRTAGIYASNADALNGPAYNFFKNGEMFRAYAGDLRFVDVDGDGIMTKGNRTLSNHGDLEIIGNQSPRYQYSINMSLNWNGIGLSMLWQGVGKRDWYPWTESGFFWGKWNRAYNSLMKTQTGDNVVKIDKSTDNWRVTNITTYNIGLDLDLFHNRLSFTGDYYRRNTTDLYTVGPNLPQVLGSAAPYGNYASLKTKGWELSLSWRDSFNLGGKPFSYSIKGMLWDSRSWITDYYNETGDLTTYYKGMEIGEIWGFRTAGIYASNADALNGPAYNFFKNGEMFRAYAGDLRFVDVDGDGIMTKGNRTLSNHGDLEIIGNQSPRYQYSINMSLNWNGIGLSMLWQGVGKRDWYPWTESGFFWGKWNRAYNSLMKTQTGDNVVKIDKSTDNWRVTNMDKNPYWTRMVSLAANRNDGPLTWENDHYLQDASYIRLKNITIDYTFPKHICKKLRLEGLKVYLSGENLFTHSPMFKHTDMFDPEVITSGDSDFAASTTSGLNGTGNGYSYPMLKTVTLGINVTF